MKRNLLRMMLMVFGVFACARSVAIAGEAQSAETVFKKSLSDGRVALVKKTTSKKKNQPTEAEQQEARRSGFIIATGEVQIDLYTLLLRDGDREVVVWEKENLVFMFPKDLFADFAVCDVETKGDRVVILFRQSGAHVEVVEKKADKGYAVVNAQTLFSGEAGGIMRLGKIAWMDGLYVVVSLGFEESIWTISEKSATRLWRIRLH